VNTLTRGSVTFKCRVCFKKYNCFTTKLLRLFDARFMTPVFNTSLVLHFLLSTAVFVAKKLDTYRLFRPVSSLEWLIISKVLSLLSHFNKFA
jgi:hypothetical protein